MTFFGFSTQVSSQELDLNQHDSSSISESWIDLTDDSSDFQEIDSE